MPRPCRVDRFLCHQTSSDISVSTWRWRVNSLTLVLNLLGGGAGAVADVDWKTPITSATNTDTKSQFMLQLICWMTMDDWFAGRVQEVCVGGSNRGWCFENGWRAFESYMLIEPIVIDTDSSGGSIWQQWAWETKRFQQINFLLNRTIIPLIFTDPNGLDDGWSTTYPWGGGRICNSRLAANTSVPNRDSLSRNSVMPSSHPANTPDCGPWWSSDDNVAIATKFLNQNIDPYQRPLLSKPEISDPDPQWRS